MEDDLISYNTAVLAREKGFDIYQPKQFSRGVNKNTVYNYTEEQCKIFKDICYRPTQSLLAKWLRKKYNIYVNSIQESMYGFNYIIEESFYKDYPKGYPDHFIDVDEPIISVDIFETPEEAIEEGLFEALKLIK